MNMTDRNQPHLFCSLPAAFLLVVLLASCATHKTNDLNLDDDGYRAALDRGETYLNKRQHSLALSEFRNAGQLRPDQAEPLYGQANALFRMDRMAETLETCAKLGVEFPEYFPAYGFCWGVRLEADGNDETVRAEVRHEIEELLARPEPSLELLNSAYTGYYYLDDRQKRFSLILRMAEASAGSTLAQDIAGALFEEIISAAPGSEQRKELAWVYIRNFPDGKMADQAAAVVLGSLSAKDLNEKERQRLVREVLHDEGSLLINGAVAHWLIEHNAELPLAIRLLHKNQGILAKRLRKTAGVPDANQQLREIREKQMLYRYFLGRALLATGKSKQAAELFKEVVTQQSDWPGPYHFLGEIALAEEKPEQALEMFRSAFIKGSPREETITRLRKLLLDLYGFDGAPLTYFQRQDGGVRFTDVTKASGLAGVKAARVAWGDYDNDGDEDLLLDGNRLFVNNHGDGKDGFSPVPDALPVVAGANGGIWGDYDNDGFLDIFVTSHQGNLLLHNDGGTGFSRSVAWPEREEVALSTEAAAWGDLNNDGLLDLYVANYEQGVVMRSRCVADQLFVNRGDSGFAEMSAAAGAVSEEAMCGRGVIWSDLNDDGWQDILVANYRLDPDFLWLNRGDGTLIDVAGAAGVQGHEVDGAYGHTIGSATGDIDGDGDLDIYNSNLAHPRYIEFSDKSILLLNNGGKTPVFTDHFMDSGISFDETSSDPLLFDADLDGDLDLFVTSIYRRRPAHLHINDGHGRFTDRTVLAGAGIMNGWGAATADYDGDGYPDLLVAASDGVHLLHNEGGNSNWLTVKVMDPNCNRFGVGGKVTAVFDGRSLVREITAGRGTGSEDSLAVHFGLGSYQGPVSVEVKTLCGDTIHYQTSDLNRTLTLVNE